MEEEALDEPVEQRPDLQADASSHNEYESHTPWTDGSSALFGSPGEEELEGFDNPTDGVDSTDQDHRRDAAAAQHATCKMFRFSLYETASKFLLVGADTREQRFRVLKIDRTADARNLSVGEDEAVYTREEMNELLNTVNHGNRSSGGLRLRCSPWGLLGFIRFTGEYYMLLITKRKQVAMIGGHYVYQIDGTELVSLRSSLARPKNDGHPEEARFVGILNNLDLSRSFYFSYSYNVTSTLQRNIQREREALHRGVPAPASGGYSDMFVWNHYLLQPALRAMKDPYDWCLAIVHGFVNQASGVVYIREDGVPDHLRTAFALLCGSQGYVANDVETEQIVSEVLTTSFHAPGPKPFANPNYTSYVQHRGSIPLHWSQDNSGVSPKPDIQLNLVDPFYGAAALHFDNLFERYGAPIYVLNLVKARERTPRESKLLKEYSNAIQYLNQFLPVRSKIIYKAFDMSRASKSRDQDVIGTLETIAEEVLKVTGFFRNGDTWPDNVRIQNGVPRTNCIDCLDRTNAAQFVIGKLALGHQLHALGVVDHTNLEYDTDLVNLFEHMYHSHGDTIAVQYGGSHLVNTMETYRKINQWTSHSRDMVESFKRYYNNSFLDAQRQEAYNLFLGNYVYTQGQPMLWDLSSDYYLHHADPRTWSGSKRRSYIRWYTPEFLGRRGMPPSIDRGLPPAGSTSDTIDDYWSEYYRPLALSSFGRIFSLRMSSTLQSMADRQSQDGRFDPSPFSTRVSPEHEPAEKPRPRKEVTILDPHQEAEEPDQAHVAASDPAPKRPRDRPSSRGILKEATADHANLLAPDPSVAEATEAFKDKAAITQWTLNQFFINSLDPSVTANEMDEYSRYIRHPQSLPLVVSTDIYEGQSPEYLSYVRNASPDASMQMHSTADDIADFVDFLDVGDEPLTVTEADPSKKRYKAYRQWLKGKSLFKQSRADP